MKASVFIGTSLDGFIARSMVTSTSYRPAVANPTATMSSWLRWMRWSSAARLSKRS